MKNIQVIDGALNCAYDVFAVDDDIFFLIFPLKDQNIEFAEDFEARLESGKLSDQEREDLDKRMWSNRVRKKDIVGIHGTLFYQLEFKKKYYPDKIDLDS